MDPSLLEKKVAEPTQSQRANVHSLFEVSFLRKGTEEDGGLSQSQLFPKLTTTPAKPSVSKSVSKEETSPKLSSSQEKTDQKDSKESAVVNDISALIPFGEVAGCLAVHIKRCRNFSSKISIEYYTKLFIRVSVSKEMKYTKSHVFDSDEKKPSIKFEEVKYFSIYVPRRQNDEKNIIYLDLMEARDVDYPILVGSFHIHLYEVIQKGCFTEEFNLKLRNLVICKIEVEFMFSYGNFGYGFSHQLKPLQKMIQPSMFLCVPPPPDRTDTRANVITPLNIEYPKFLSKDIRATIGNPEELSPLVQLEKLQQKPRERLRRMKREYRKLKTWEEKANYLRKILKLNPEVKDIFNSKDDSFLDETKPEDKKKWQYQEKSQESPIIPPTSLTVDEPEESTPSLPVLTKDIAITIESIYQREDKPVPEKTKAKDKTPKMQTSFSSEEEEEAPINQALFSSPYEIPIRRPISSEDKTPKMQTSFSSEEEEAPIKQVSFSSPYEIPIIKQPFSSKDKTPKMQTSFSSEEEEAPIKQVSFSSPYDIPIKQPFSSEDKTPAKRTSFSSEEETPTKRTSFSSEEDAPIKRALFLFEEEAPIKQASFSSEEEAPIIQTFSSIDRTPSKRASFSSEEEAPIKRTFSSIDRIPSKQASFSSEEEAPIKPTFSSKDKTPSKQASISSYYSQLSLDFINAFQPETSFERSISDSHAPKQNLVEESKESREVPKDTETGPEVSLPPHISHSVSDEAFFPLDLGEVGKVRDKPEVDDINEDEDSDIVISPAFKEDTTPFKPLRPENLPPFQTCENLDRDKFEPFLRNLNEDKNISIQHGPYHLIRKSTLSEQSIEVEDQDPP